MVFCDILQVDRNRKIYILLATDKMRFFEGKRLWLHGKFRK
tara:strand:+ start:158 stop:280 length:123 start_codon:yes stop_codon:yes gene_type:complete